MSRLFDILEKDTVNHMWFREEGSLVWAPEKPSFLVVDDPFLLEVLKYYGYDGGQFLKQASYQFKFELGRDNAASFWFKPQIKGAREENNHILTDLFTTNSSSKKVEPTEVRMGFTDFETAAFCSNGGHYYAQIKKKFLDYFKAIGFDRVYSQRRVLGGDIAGHKENVRSLTFFRGKKPIGAIAPYPNR